MWSSRVGSNRHTLERFPATALVAWVRLDILWTLPFRILTYLSFFVIVGNMNLYVHNMLGVVRGAKSLIKYIISSHVTSRLISEVVSLTKVKKGDTADLQSLPGSCAPVIYDLKPPHPGLKVMSHSCTGLEKALWSR